MHEWAVPAQERGKDVVPHLCTHASLLTHSSGLDVHIPPPPSESHPSFKGPLRFYLLQAVSPNYSSPLVPPSLDKLTLTT